LSRWRLGRPFRQHNTFRPETETGGPSRQHVANYTATSVRQSWHKRRQPKELHLCIFSPWAVPPPPYPREERYEGGKESRHAICGSTPKAGPKSPQYAAAPPGGPALLHSWRGTTSRLAGLVRTCLASSTFACATMFSWTRHTHVAPTRSLALFSTMRLCLVF